MIYEGTKIIYEVWGYDTPETSEPCARETFAKKADAKKAAKDWSKKYGRVEALYVEVAVDDERDIYADGVLVAYENGKKTTK